MQLERLNKCGIKLNDHLTLRLCLVGVGVGGKCGGEVNVGVFEEIGVFGWGGRGRGK